MNVCNRIYLSDLFIFRDRS